MLIGKELLRKILIFALPLICAACVQQPIVDTKGINVAQYNHDRSECEAYAEQVQMTHQAAAGAVAGAVVGAALGATLGNSDDAKRGAGAGGVVGVTRGTGRALEEKQRVVHNCLRHRGYAVLN